MSASLSFLVSLSASFVFLCSGHRCPCDSGQLCPPPAFPDLFGAFQDTLIHSQLIRNLTDILLSQLVRSSCRYSLLTSVDWTDFNHRRCSVEADVLEHSDDECRHVPYQGLARLPSPPVQPISVPRAPPDTIDKDEYDEIYEEEDDEDDDEWEEEEDGDAEETRANGVPFESAGGDIVVGEWLQPDVSTSSRPLPNPRQGFSLNPQGIALIVGISCSIVSLVCGIVILVYIRRRYYSHPKYETPPEEAVCLRWMQSRFGVGGEGNCSSHDQCYSAAAEERMRTNAPGHPVKRYL